MGPTKLLNLCFSLIATIILLYQTHISEAQTKTNSFVFGPFNASYYNTFDVIQPAAINNEALQVTPDSVGNFSLTNNSGRIFFNQGFKLWETGHNGKVASFNASFLINIYRVNGTTPAEGLAFLIAPETEPPANSYGQYLGLTNSISDGNPSNQFVAIEFDTFKQEFDPDDNHIGLDINSVVSKKNVSLDKFGIELAPEGTKFYVVWIEYNGTSKVLDVYIVEQPDRYAPTVNKPGKPVLTSDLDLSTIVRQNSYFGFAASTGNFYQLNCVLKWNLTVEALPGDGSSTGHVLKIALGVGVPVFVLLLLSVAGFGYYLHRRKITTSGSNILGALKSLPGVPREFSYKDLKQATHNFDEKNKLGQGGFGVVYKGLLGKEKLEIAVKKFSRDNIKSKDDFLAELTIINRLRHKHLVRLLGWCHQNGVLLLVYEFMPNGSLDAHLFSEPGKSATTISWQVRYKIAAGVASALHYLHDEYDQKVVHRDLKASNIMLDSNFNARLGDFGLARALEHEKTSYAELSGVPGTIGYIAPECFHNGKATCESDVYGFGAVLLEVVCGQRPWTKNEGFQFLVDWVWYLHRDGRILQAVDGRLGNEYVVEEAERLLFLGLACSHPSPSDRPKAQEIVQIISGSVPVPHVPAFKPAFVWPSTPAGSSIADFSTGTSEFTCINTNSSLEFGRSDSSIV